MPEAQRGLLGAYLARCAKASPELRWVGAGSLHLTLRFLGNLGHDRLEAVASGLAGIRARPFEIAIGGLGFFGRGRRASVVWMGLRAGAAEAGALATLADAAAVAAGLSSEARPFRAHITLARARSREGVEQPELPQPPDLSPWTAGEMVLYQSVLNRSGAVYSRLGGFPLET